MTLSGLSLTISSCSSKVTQSNCTICSQHVVFRNTVEFRDLVSIEASLRESISVALKMLLENGLHLIVQLSCCSRVKNVALRPYVAGVRRGKGGERGIRAY